MEQLTHELETVGFSREQAREIAGLKVETLPLLSVDDRASLYAVSELILELGDKEGWDKAIDYAKSVLHDQTGTVAEAVEALIYQSPLLAKVKNKNEAEIRSFKRKKASAKGLYTCKGCGSKETVSVEKQLRSADEPMTLIITCVVCGKTWRQ